MTYRLAYALTKLLEQVNAAAPHRSTLSDGWIGDATHFAQGSASDHNPWVTWNGEGIVTAVDITHDPANGCDVWKLAQAIAASRDPRLKYLIYTGHEGGAPGILSSTVSPWTWRVRRYDDHPHHLHLSVNSDKGSYDSTTPWAIGFGAPASAIPSLPRPSVVVAKVVQKVTRAALAVDGVMGRATICQWQRVMGTPVDGIISRPSSLVRAVQRRCGVVADGIPGPITWRAIQRRLGVTQDGVPGPVTIKALQRKLNAGQF